MNHALLPSDGAAVFGRRPSQNGAAFGASARGMPSFRRMEVAVIVTFWITQIVIVTAVRFMKFDSERLMNVTPRAFVTIYAVLASLGLLAALKAMRGRSLGRGVTVAAGLALIGTLLHTAVNMVTMMAYFGDDASYSVGEYLLFYSISSTDFIWFYCVLMLMLLALAYGEELVDNRKRIAALQDKADSARLNALRYQLNPHFLFNTLNSVAGLISTKNEPRAEAMVLSLSDFLHSTLKMADSRDIPLGEELELQSLYLDIEKIRFPHRLRVSVDVPEHLRDILVPNLITQPLIENAIKHGVGRSSTIVHLEVVASVMDGKLSLEIKDDGGDAHGGEPPGSHTGLCNVADRVKLHFGDEGSFVAGKRAGGGFSARILIPMRKAGAACGEAVRPPFRPDPFAGPRMARRLEA